MPSSLHQECSHGIPTWICLHFERLAQFRKCQNWCLNNLFFSLSKYFCWFFPHWKLSPFVVMVWSGATTIAYDAMNFRRYCVAAKKILTSVTFVGTGHFMMASIFAVSILRSPQPITYPKCTKYGWENSHFLILANKWFFFRVYNTCIRCAMCSYQVAL